ncbi:MAG: RsiV family protein, partial [Anaerolineae bacterium]
AVARAAAATLTAEAPGLTMTPTPPTVLDEMGARDLGGGLRLLMQETKDDGQTDYGYHFWTPLLVGPEEGVTATFNRAVDGFTTYALDEFRQWIAGGLNEPGSTIWMTHTVTFATDDLVSVLFYVDGYVIGAAHPFHYSHSLNHELGETSMLELADLFRPASDYLEVMSRYCLDDLERQGVLEWEEGALPQAENFQRWNITPEGLLISFDEYTIAPYAAGPHEVLIPYTVLEPFADPEGPLGRFLPIG